jgi:hypothetical protein
VRVCLPTCGASAGVESTKYVVASWSVVLQGHVVQRWLPGAEHGWRGDLDEQHLDEELYSGGEEMAGVAEG